MAERTERRHPRAPIEGPVWILGNGDPDWTCRLVNISVGGFLAECDRPPGIGNRVRVALRVQGERIVAQCRVVHGAPLGSPGEPRYRLGVEFGPLSLRDVRHIGDYVERQRPPS